LYGVNNNIDFNKVAARKLKNASMVHFKDTTPDGKGRTVASHG